jgi:pyruvate, water dikinase
MFVASKHPACNIRFCALVGCGNATELLSDIIINNYIKVHPLALLQHSSLNDAALSAEIKILISGFASEEDYFVKKLSFGIAKIAAAFYPSTVIVRFSDFKSNEYFNLLGGKYLKQIGNWVVP